MTTLNSLLELCGDAVERDLRLWWRFDLIDYFRGRASARQVLNLLRGLPKDCETATAHAEAVQDAERDALIDKLIMQERRKGADRG